MICSFKQVWIIGFRVSVSPVSFDTFINARTMPTDATGIADPTDGVRGRHV